MLESGEGESADAILAGSVIAQEVCGGAAGAEIVEGLNDGDAFEIACLVDTGGEVDKEVVDVDDIGL